MKKGLDTDKCLIFSAIMIILFTVSMIITFWWWNTVPDSLIVAFFAAFSCEGGYCVMVHKIKKEKLTMGDITGFDDAEVLDFDDEGELVIDTESEDE